jgi:hypothetical protein
MLHTKSVQLKKNVKELSEDKVALLKEVESSQPLLVNFVHFQILV